ncbi:hypothetical protein IGI04_030793 [Brassica rapa subsp. trilocularis]|uniref:Zinc knuckle CX2CX4HX4C domain-containing protein n=1 Tax=Brassica rapa subsp. trilocularis TaxID=1813537 RepID=A0ABQ7LRS1_BRACM|nr:hypothetical protein IGI04_030793 [Brassica rapa subsp. trilocularis]
MSQGLLLGKEIERMNGEGTRKRIKISIPHFDNSDLIKSYSQTLIGHVDLDYGKMRVVLDGRNELCFDSMVDFKGGEYYEGEEVLVTLKYEKLFGHCSLCASLCHTMEVCPLNPNPVKPSENKDLGVGKHEERARSYKGVVINGDNGQSEKDKEWRRPQGKGKGKVHEGQEAKWERVPDRGSKRSSTYHPHNKIEEGSSRHRGARWETTRRQEEEARSRYNPAPRREHTPLRRLGEDSREEGEFRRSGNVKEAPLQVVSQPAAAGLEQMTVPVSESAKITTDTTGVENGLDLVDAMLADGLHTLDQFGSNEGLEWAGEEEEIGDEELQEDGLDALMVSMEQPLTIAESEAKDTITEDETIQIGDNGHQSNERGTEEVQVETKTGTRKPAGLPNIGINTKKFGQVLLSPRKRAVLKHGNRKGAGIKQPEEKGSLHPKQLMKN